MRKRDSDPEDFNAEELRKQNSESLVYKIWVILCGNGEPKKGILWKVNQLMDFKDTVESAVKKIKNAAYVAAGSALGMFLWTVLKDQIIKGNM